ncbi:MAG: phosphoribosyltransferase domain-containing protein [Muribaculaceae bacterium]|nr:phosphoribosyltransferase domain-containing protein [Muribaculaceae bacterium]
MQVLTLDPIAFDRHAEKLAQIVEESCNEKFDAIVAVRRGGSFVCDAFCRHFPEDRYRSRYDVALQRPSTKRKNGKVSYLLKRLPYPILDIMRMVESTLFSLRRKIKAPTSTPSVGMPEGLIITLREKEFPNILIIDDAIDSGDTLLAIAETLRKTNENTNVRIAVLTETTSHPRIRADYSLYRNKTLIRFPWSNDYKTRLPESPL